MMNNTQVINKLKETLILQFGEIINDVVLFGSRANGKSTEQSDYDVIIVLKNDYDWTFEKEISKTIYKFELKYGIFTDVHLISESQIKNTLRGKDPLFVNALSNGIYV